MASSWSGDQYVFARHTTDYFACLPHSTRSHAYHVAISSPHLLLLQDAVTQQVCGQPTRPLVLPDYIEQAEHE